MDDYQRASDANLQDNIMWIGKTRTKAVYYKADGSATKPLPADPWNKQLYLAKGFSLKPKARDDLEISGVKCPWCDFEPKNALSLRTHLKKHVGKI